MAGPSTLRKHRPSQKAAPPAEEAAVQAAGPAAGDERPALPVLLVRLLTSSIALTLGTHYAAQLLRPIYGVPLMYFPYTHLLAYALALLAPPAGAAGFGVGTFPFMCSLNGASNWIVRVGAWSGSLGTLAGPALGWLGVAGWGTATVGQAAQTLLIPYTSNRYQARLLGAIFTSLLVSEPISSLAARAPYFSGDSANTSQRLLLLGGLVFFADLVASTIYRPQPAVPASTAAQLRSYWRAPGGKLQISFMLLYLAADYLVPPMFTEPNPAVFPLLEQTHARPAQGLGLLQVGENYDLPGAPPKSGYRFLRADHSLLGGRWIGPLAETAGEKGGVGDSVFSAFVLQEAVRLVGHRDWLPREEQEKALVIGLGVGVAARAMILHNLSTTVVEYDPQVFSYAQQYFSLPDPAAVILRDANAWVQEEASAARVAFGEGFSYVVHDVFTGGQVPGELFTVEFWSNLKSLMHPTGVLAVNFAGVQRTKGAQAVVRTLLASWEACSGFRDAMGEGEGEPGEDDLRNLVIFCTPYHPPGGRLTFRLPTEADFLESGLRRRALSSFKEHPVDLRALAGDSGGELLKRGRAGATLKYLQGRAEGEATWRAMRALMPTEVWNRW